MSRTLLINFLRFVVLVFIQVFLLKNVTLYNFSTPYLYVLFILLLPFETPNLILFLLAFVLGLTIDAFYDTPGLHAFACVIMAFARILFISVTVQKDGFDNEPDPSLGIMGFRWFFFYAIILTSFHHLTLFFLETFNITEIEYTLVRVVLSTLLTVFLILLCELIFFKKKERR